MHRVRAAVLIAVVSLAALLSAAPAGATHVGCGTVITTNTVLDSDVGPCAGPAIVIAANFVVLDLNGHSVFGTAATGDGAGIVFQRVKGSVVRNGEVWGFDAGVLVDFGGNNVVHHLSVHDNISAADDIFDLGDGILVRDSRNNRIHSNTVVHNGPHGGITMQDSLPTDGVVTTSGNQVLKNKAIRNDVCRSASLCDDIGIRVENEVTRTRIAGNQVALNGLDGINIFRRAPGSVIYRNNVRGNGFHSAAHRLGDGIRVFVGADDTTIRENRSFDNAANGIIVGSLSNSILSNLTGRNGGGAAGTSVFDLHDQNTDCDANVWSGNTFDTASPACTTA